MPNMASLALASSEAAAMYHVGKRNRERLHDDVHKGVDSTYCVRVSAGCKIQGHPPTAQSEIQAKPIQ